MHTKSLNEMQEELDQLTATLARTPPGPEQEELATRVVEMEYAVKMKIEIVAQTDPRL